MVPIESSYTASYIKTTARQVLRIKSRFYESARNVTHQGAARATRPAYISSEYLEYGHFVTVVNLWNRLPSDVVGLSAPSVNAFKSRLDNYWENYCYTLDPEDFL